MTRNGGRVRLEMPAQVGVVTPTGTTLTLQIPAQANNPFYPVVTRNFVYNVFNATTIQQGVGTISTTGLVTFTGLTGGVGYTFLYGVTTL
jgi:hypothetical protein